MTDDKDTGKPGRRRRPRRKPADRLQRMDRADIPTEELYREEVRIPRELYLETATTWKSRHVQAERARLWEERDSLEEAVKNNGIRSLSREEFSRYHLLTELFKTGYVYVADVRSRAHRRFRPSLATDEAVNAACRFVMHGLGLLDAEAAISEEDRFVGAAVTAAVDALPADATPAARADAREKAVVAAREEYRKAHEHGGDAANPPTDSTTDGTTKDTNGTT